MGLDHVAKTFDFGQDSAQLRDVLDLNRDVQCRDVCLPIGINRRPAYVDLLIADDPGDIVKQASAIEGRDLDSDRNGVVPRAPVHLN